MKKSKRKRLENKIYKLVCKKVHERGECELCGNSGCKLDAHHLQGRTGQLKYHLPNLILLCFRCHRLGVHAQDSYTQNKFREKIKAIRGDIDDLVKLKDQKLSILELENLLKIHEGL